MNHNSQTESLNNPYTNLEREPNQFNSEELDLPKEEELASNFTIFLMLLKSALGLGVFVLPHLCKGVGYLGFPIFYTLPALSSIFFMTLVFISANKIEYRGRK